MRYYIIAGEASGDLHGSNLMRGLYAEDSSAEIRFWGGDAMDGVYKEMQKSGGGGLVRHYKAGAVMGFSDVVAKLGKLLGNLSFCKKDILAWKPDVVILIDYPGFNFRVAEFAHSQGLKVFYYIAPKTWASREGRNRKLKAWVDKLFIIFPFEKEYFRSRGIDYIYKGNPLVDAVDGSEAMRTDREDFLSREGLPDGPYIALLAGSRKGEISTMMPGFMAFADALRAIPEYAGWRFVIAGAPSRSMDDYASYIGERDYVSVLFGQTYGVLRHAEAAVINSGTASLEAVLVGTPQVVAWGTSALSYALMKRFAKVRFISLGNLILDRLAFKELIQDAFTTEAVLSEVRRMLEDKEYRAKMLGDYALIRSELGGSGASRAVASEMIKILESQ